MPPKQLHLVRHAQGFHNLSPAHHSIHDPLLTAKGEQQCIKLSSQIDDIQSIDCIVASPSKRTLYTALVTFKSVLETKPGLKIIALPELQETSDMPCDTGSSVDDLKREFEGKPVDLSHVHDGWNNKTSGPFYGRVDLVTERCWKARMFLRERKEENVAVVSHGGLLHFLTEDWADSMNGCGTGWSNCELRTYTFDTSTTPSIANATIRETDASLLRRSRSLLPLTEDEQMVLRDVAQQSWAADGYIISMDATDAEYTGSDEAYESRDSAIDMNSPLHRTRECSMERMEVQEGIEVRA